MSSYFRTMQTQLTEFRSRLIVHFPFEFNESAAGGSGGSNKASRKRKLDRKSSVLEQLALVTQLHILLRHVLIHSHSARLSHFLDPIIALSARIQPADLRTRADARGHRASAAASRSRSRGRGPSTFGAIERSATAEAAERRIRRTARVLAERSREGGGQRQSFSPQSNSRRVSSGEARERCGAADRLYVL